MREGEQEGGKKEEREGSEGRKKEGRKVVDSQ